METRSSRNDNIRNSFDERQVSQKIEREKVCITDIFLSLFPNISNASINVS